MAHPPEERPMFANKIVGLSGEASAFLRGYF
jgi:hypothetical protein